MKRFVVIVMGVFALAGCTTVYGPPSSSTAELKSPRVDPAAPRDKDAAALQLDFTSGRWRVFAAVDVNGNSWDNSTLVFTKQTAGDRRVKLEGYFEWMLGGRFQSKERFSGYCDVKSGRLLLTGSGAEFENRNRGKTATYEGRVSEDGRTIHEGEWYGRDIVPGVWSASIVSDLKTRR